MGLLWEGTGVLPVFESPQMPATWLKVKFLSEHLFHSYRNWRWKRPEDIWSIPVVVQEKWLEQSSLLTSCSQDSISVLGAEWLHTHCNEDAEQILFTDLRKYLEALHFHKMIGSEIRESVGVPRWDVFDRSGRVGWGKGRTKQCRWFSGFNA